MRRTFNLSLVAALSSLLMVSVAMAAEPCVGLSEEHKTLYDAAVQEGTTLAAEADHSAAIAAFLRAAKLCDEDPRVDFQVAQAYEAIGKCDMARFWYEELLTHDEEDHATLVKKERKQALDASTRLRVQCPNSVRVDFECEAGVMVSLGVELSGVCPLAGRVEGGTYELTMAAEGFQTQAFELKLAAEDGQNRIFLPPMQATVPDSLGAKVTIQCHGVQSAKLGDVDGPCGGEVDIAQGTYDMTVPGVGDAGAIELKLGDSAVVHLAAATPVEEIVYVEPSSPMTTAGWILTSTGAVVFGGGLAVHLLSESDRAGALAQRHSGSAAAQTTIDDAQLMSTLGLVGVGVGGAALLTGGLLLYLGQSDSDIPTVQAFVTPEEGFISVGGQW